eukprot:scaffold569_cov165-Amphora_coffeaeformis.AAC.4
MPISTERATEEDETWEVNAVKPRRKREGNKKGQRGPGKNKSFGGWAKPAMPKAKEVVEEKKDPVVITEDANQQQADFMMQPMSSLLAEYGDFDPNWMDKQPEIEQEETPDEKATEEGEEDDDTSCNRLGQQGKAPLHVDVVSFGFRYGAPSTRKDGWMQTTPLLPFDCRDVLPPVPGYLLFHDGKTSGQVKRFLLYDYKRQAYRNSQKKESSDDEPIEPGPSVRDYSVDTVAPQIYNTLLEAVRSGGYGYALPLKIQIFVGSEWGRHRSVVAVEQTATALRKLLRKCQDNVLECPCSVATQHRDIERKIPSKKDRDDDD